MGWLAIDPGSRCGWAYYQNGGNRVETGTWRLGDAKITKGERYLRLLKSLMEFAASREVTKIAIEGPALARSGSSASHGMSEAWVPLLSLFCAMKGLPEPAVAASTSWRKAFLGYGQLSKDMRAKLKTDKARRDHWKSATIERCQERGSHPNNDEEADAIGILFWAVNGGDQANAKRAAMKKQKTLDKRRQTKMDLQVAV
tara:strand:+ start:345 stop:944 length:600 start_codon:yes stop_codon:yes gene_type:complete